MTVEAVVKMLSVRLDDNEFAALSKLSEQPGETRSQVVKRGITELARLKLDRESPHELAEKLGVIGAFSGRANLSQTVSAGVKRKLRAETARRR